MEIGDAGRSIGRYLGFDLREVGDWEHGEIIGEATAPLHDQLRGPGGGVRAGALLTLCDSVGGFCAGLAALPDGWVVSTNLTVTIAPYSWSRLRPSRHGASAMSVTERSPAPSGPLLLRTTVLRAGRSAVVTDVRVTDTGSDGAIVADAVLTSAVLVPEGGPPTWERPARMKAPPLDGPLPPLIEWLGVREVAGAPPGVVELDITDAVRNPWGIVHGGVTASLVDVAAERVVAARSAGPVVAVETGDVALHFLAPSRVGPVRATATVLGDRADGSVVLVEVRDMGQDRVAARAVAAVRPR
jgi:1,4-dihydroxy-2-naphthoyl-CoA hydrolase